MAITVTVKEATKLDLISLDKSKSAREAAEVMVKRNISAVVVSESGRLVGIVTERDLLRKVTVTSRDPAKVTLSEIMTAPLITIGADQSLGQATALMIEKRIRRLLVEEGGKIIGIVTQSDLQEKILEAFLSLSQTRDLI